MAKRGAVTDLRREVRGSSEEHPQTMPPLGSALALPIGGRARTLLRRGPPHRPPTKIPKKTRAPPQISAVPRPESDSTTPLQAKSATSSPPPLQPAAYLR